ncbi:MAG TPA: Flp family type IVb pilin, partial [Parvibaculum sp.]
MTSAKLKAFVTRFAADDSGLSAVEYGLLAAGIVLAITVSLGTIGTNLGEIFQSLSDKVASANT